MRIMIYITGMEGGGAERQTAILSNNFTLSGHDVCIVVKTHGRSRYMLHQKVRIIVARKLRDSQNKVQAIINNISNIMSIGKIIRKEAPDIVFCVGITRLFDVVFATVLKSNVRVVYFEVSNPYKNLHDKTWKLLKRPLSRVADGCLFQTERAAGYYPISVRKRSAVIPNPIESQRYENLKDISKRKKVIVSAGRLIPLKGYDVLLKAFSKVSDVFPDYNLVIYGEGGERESLSVLSKTLGISHKVNFPGFSEDIISDIYDASVFVLSSHHEGMPNTLMEAMACGIPCVSTDCEMGPRELIDDGVNGLLVPVGDVDKMADAIISLLSSSEFASSLGKNAKRILKTHDERFISSKLLDYFSSLR